MPGHPGFSKSHPVHYIILIILIILITPHPPGNYNKHHWAKVDVPEIQKAMRWTYDNQETAKEIGQRAQDNMFENFTRCDG